MLDLQIKKKLQLFHEKKNIVDINIIDNMKFLRLLISELDDNTK